MSRSQKDVKLFGKMQEKIDLLKAENDELRKSCDIQHDSWQDQVNQNERLEARVAELEEENRKLDDRSHGFELDVVDLRYSISELCECGANKIICQWFISKHGIHATAALKEEV